MATEEAMLAEIASYQRVTRNLEQAMSANSTEYTYFYWMLADLTPLVQQVSQQARSRAGENISGDYWMTDNGPAERARAEWAEVCAEYARVDVTGNDLCFEIARHVSQLNEKFAQMENRINVLNGRIAGLQTELRAADALPRAADPLPNG